MWSTSDPVSKLGLSLAIILIAAKVGGDVASRLRQPAVLGELVIGIVLGSLPLPFLRELRTDPGLDLLARLGVILLLFEVGLESTVHDVLRVGIASARVAVLGTIGSLACVWVAARLVMPAHGALVLLFVTGALTATSIGISARVMKDTGASRTLEARTILGAAVFDDILGLIVLALVSSAVIHAQTHGVTGLGVVWLVTKMILFLAFALIGGVHLAPRIFRVGARLRSDGTMLAIALSACFILAWAADIVGLAPIVGAFAAGLILEEWHASPFVERGERTLRERMEPLSLWLVPVFFVLVGMRADFSALADWPTLLVVLALTAASIVGKLACGLGVPRGADRLAVAIGMIPRGEVSLVFANLGRSLRVGGAPLLDSHRYSALVTVILLTALVTPPALRWRFRRSAVLSAPESRDLPGASVG